MPESSVMTLVSILQRHGLTVMDLEDMVHFCERKRTGSITLHIVLGTFKQIEDHGKRTMGTESERCPAPRAWPA